MEEYGLFSVVVDIMVVFFINVVVYFITGILR